MLYICHRCGKVFEYDEEDCAFHDRVDGWLDEIKLSPDLKLLWGGDPICVDCVIEEVEKRIEKNKKYN